MTNIFSYPFTVYERDSEKGWKKKFAVFVCVTFSKDSEVKSKSISPA